MLFSEIFSRILKILVQIKYKKDLVAEMIKKSMDLMRHWKLTLAHFSNEVWSAGKVWQDASFVGAHTETDTLVR